MNELMNPYIDEEICGNCKYQSDLPNCECWVIDKKKAWGECRQEMLDAGYRRVPSREALSGKLILLLRLEDEIELGFESQLKLADGIAEELHEWLKGMVE